MEKRTLRQVEAFENMMAKVFGQEAPPDDHHPPLPNNPAR